MKKILARTASIMLAASLTAACLASCGSDDSSEKKTGSKADSVADSVSEDEESSLEEVSDEGSEKSEDLTGEEQSWGCFTVLVPNGWTFRKGDVFDDNDERYCSVKKSDFSYFDLKNENEETATNHYEYNKKTYTNEQRDIPATKIGDIEWTGFEYGNDFGGGFELYAKVGDKFLRISSAGFKFDGIVTKTVLGSLKIK